MTIEDQLTNETEQISQHFQKNCQVTKVLLTLSLYALAQNSEAIVIHFIWKDTIRTTFLLEEEALQKKGKKTFLELLMQRN